MIVLDSSALLALVQDEPGASYVAERALGAAVSTVNYTEVLTRVIDLQRPADAAAQAISRLRLDLVSYDHALAERAGTLRESTRSLGLSLGDRACLALAERLGASVLTADRVWSRLDLGLDIRLIR